MCKGGENQWLSSDEPVVKIVAKMLEVIVSKPHGPTHGTVLLQRFHQVSASTVVEHAVIAIGTTSPTSMHLARVIVVAARGKIAYCNLIFVTLKFYYSGVLCIFVCMSAMLRPGIVLATSVSLCICWQKIWNTTCWKLM